MAEEKNVKVTYFDKKSIACPACSREFQREVLMSGSGRLIAGKLTDELRRLYQPSKKYGRINPLVYPVVVCPDCLYAAFPEDFSRLSEKSTDKMREFTDRRIQLVMQSVGPVDFSETRDDRAGAASYILATSCYSFFDKSISPTVKRGLCCLRGAWVLNDMVENTEPGEDRDRYAWVSNILYHKAYKFYSDALDLYQKKVETIEGIALGPDTDKNWGYEGFLYTVSQLCLKLGFTEDDLEKRAMSYLGTKRIIAKLFGSGKASKSKPSEILDMSRILYDKLDAYVKEIEETLGKKFE
ncbi:MAG TPA: DUF2225 domain-containing protein [Spirochaetota bacterium]|nr:DUF2225 domain-containing protein [Spirochaetota bacterium]HPH03025.1 DUF2225 domain-containing protein [Spirochaetota bacterium]HPN82742.1 DUF2225 domain-containing protein [Spirochaetota bacterium]